MWIQRSLILFLLIIISQSCSKKENLKKNQPVFQNPYFRFISDLIYPPSSKVLGTIFGGISAIRYSVKNNEIYALSDNRGDYGPPRFYKIYLQLSTDKLALIPYQVYFLQKQTGYFPTNFLDPEGLDIFDQKILISTEKVKNPNSISQILSFDLQGKLETNIQLPPRFQQTLPNKGIEALAFTHDKKWLFAGIEGQDKKWTNILILKNEKGNITAQKEIFYPLQSKKYGLVEILPLNEHSFLALERNYSAKKNKTNILLFKVEIKDSPNILSQKVLSYKEMSGPLAKKTLLLNFDDLIPVLSKEYQQIDNIEAFTWGPSLPNGNPTLIFASDDNFSPHQRTVFMALEIIKPILR